MKRMFALACLALFVVAGVAQAGTPGINLSWANCSTSAVADKAYACDGALGSVISFQGTFRPDVNLPDFAGVSCVVDFGFQAATPDYWKTDGANCNAGAMTIGNPTAAAPCATPNIFDVNFSGGGFATDYPAPNRVRLRVDWATGAPVPPALTSGSLYPAFKITFDPDAGVNLSCAGCTTPGCIVLNMVEVFGFGGATEDYKYEGFDVRQYVTWQGGAIGGAGCPDQVPTQNKTWGSIKAMYR